MGAKGNPKTPGSGRKKNTPNKVSIPLQELSQEMGVDPFEILLLFAAGDWKKLGYQQEIIIKHGAQGVQNEEYVIQPHVRAKAAAEAAQYLYPKLKAIDHKMDGGINLNHVVAYIPVNGSEAVEDKK
jgi:hypothetical protein